MTAQWVGPDFGGAYWLEGKHENVCAVVGRDVTGDTDKWLWSIQINEYADSVAEGSAIKKGVAIAAAKAALKKYEKQVDRSSGLCYTCGTKRKEQR
jgi:hypothetical protein